MRLKTAFLNDVEIYRRISVKSDYIGMETVWELIGNIKADIQSAENTLNTAIYGESVKDMKTVYTSYCDIAVGDRVHISGDIYETVSVKTYRSHMILTVKKI